MQIFNRFSGHQLLAEIDRCFKHFSGQPLPCPQEMPSRYDWLDKLAPYALVAHSADINPHFIYANQAALTFFKYTREEFLSLPSAKSAGPDEQSARNDLLSDVKRYGIARGYTGLRLDKMGRAFRIRDGIVWQLAEEEQQDNVWGQAALFYADE